MRGINKVILVGTLGNDPDTRYTASGAAITNISIATNDSWTDKQTGERQERTEWHRVVFFSRLAEIAAQYLRKGSQVYVEGRLQTRKWQDKSGQDRWTTEIVGSEMQMLGGRADVNMNANTGGGAYGGGAPSQGGGAPMAHNAPAAAPAMPSNPTPMPGAAPKTDFDDDVPF